LMASWSWAAMFGNLFFFLCFFCVAGKECCLCLRPRLYRAKHHVCPRAGSDNRDARGTPSPTSYRRGPGLQSPREVAGMGVPFGRMANGLGGFAYWPPVFHVRRREDKAVYGNGRRLRVGTVHYGYDCPQNALVGEMTRGTRTDLTRRPGSIHGNIIKSHCPGRLRRTDDWRTLLFRGRPFSTSSRVV